MSAPTYRRALPQLPDAHFLTDSGLETDLIFNAGFDLPEFASFVLLDDPASYAATPDCLNYRAKALLPDKEDAGHQVISTCAVAGSSVFAISLGRRVRSAQSGGSGA
jgi:hypothetical protein